MRQSSIPASSFAVQVTRARTGSGSLMILAGKRGPAFDAPADGAAAKPQCTECADFVQVVTHDGVAVCTNSVHTEDHAALPFRLRLPQPRPSVPTS